MSAEPDGETEAVQPGRLHRARESATQKAVRYERSAEARWPHVAMLREMWARYRRLNATALAGNLAFRVFIWLLPAMLLMVAAVAAASQGGIDVESEAANTFGISGSMADAVGTAAQEGQRSKWQAGALALFGLLLASSGLLSALHYAALQLWELPAQSPQGRAARALKLGGSFIVALLVTLALGAARRSNVVVGVAAVAIGATFVALMLLALFWMMPRRATGWIWLVPGAITGGLGYFLLQGYTSFYLPRHVSSLSTTYGTLGVAAASLGYLFLLGLLLVLATLVNTVWWDYHHPDSAEAALDGIVDQDATPATSTRVTSTRPERSDGVRSGFDDPDVQTNNVRPSDPPNAQA